MIPKILVIDDNPDDIVLVKEMVLDSIDIEVIETNSGKEALKILEEDNDFAVILLDLNIPDMNGVEIAKSIKRENNKILPIIFLSMLFSEETKEEVYLATEAVDFLPKPRTKLDVKMLLSKVKMFLELYIQRKKLETQIEKTQKAEEKYKSLIEFTNTGYVILNTDLNVIDANSLYIKMFEFKNLNDIIGCNLRDCVNEDNLVAFDIAFQNVLNKEVISDLEIEVTNQKREYVAIRLDASLIENGDHKIFCLVKDISEKKKKEKRIKEVKTKKRLEIRKDLEDLNVDVQKCFSKTLKNKTLKRE